MTNNNQDVLARLKRLKKENPELTEIIDLQHALLEIQTQVTVHLSILQYSTEEVQARFEQGIPLLRAEEMALDWDTFIDLYRKVCRISGQHRPDLGDLFHTLEALPDRDPDRLKASTTIYLKEGRLLSEEQTQQDELFAFVLNHTLRPFLKTYAQELKPVVEQKRWQRDRCPVCGGEPDLAFLDKDSGARHLVCSRCDSQWLFARVKCPYCGTSDSKHLSYYPSEDEKYRLYVCQNCQRYLKAIDLRQVRTKVLYPIERIASVALDAAARQQGFH